MPLFSPLTTPLLSAALHNSPVFLEKDVCSLSEALLLLIGKSQNKAGMDNKPVPLLVFSFSYTAAHRQLAVSGAVQ